MIKAAELRHDMPYNQVYKSDGLTQCLKDVPYSKILEVGQGGALYGAEGQVSAELVEAMVQAPNAMRLSKASSLFKKFDISPNYMSDGKVDVQKLKFVEQELNIIENSLKELGCTGTYDCALATLFELKKSDPQIVEQVFELLGSLPELKRVGNLYNAKDVVFRTCCDNKFKQIDMELLNLYASMSADLFEVVVSNSWITSFMLGKNVESINLELEVSRLSQESKAVLSRHGLDFDYVLAAKRNKDNRKSEVSEQAQQKFEKTIKSCDVVLSQVDVSRGIELEYTRAAFEKDVWQLVKDLPSVESQRLLNYYGLTMNEGKLEGVLCKPSVKPPINVAEVARELEVYIDKFSNNKVLTSDPKLNSLYSSLVNEFPEFKMLVERVGRDGQRVDVTVLKELQALINNAQYQELTPKEQTIAKLVLLFRGFDAIDSSSNVIEKEFFIDNDGRRSQVTHKRYKNSEYTAAILKRFNFSEVERYMIGDLVAHSGWSKAFNNGVVDIDLAVDKSEFSTGNLELEQVRNARKVAVNNRFGTLKLSKIIEDVINPGNDVNLDLIVEKQKQMYQRMQVVNTVTAKDLEGYWEKQQIDGVEVEVLDLRKTELPKDFYLLGHFIEHSVDHLYDLLSNPNDKVFFSNSLIKPDAASTFASRTKGIISEFSNRNVAETQQSNIDSGFGKSYNTFVMTMTGEGSRDVAKVVQEKLNLSVEDYGLLMEQIVDKRLNAIDDAYVINGRTLTKEDIVKAHNDAYEMLLSAKGEQNEITVLSQKPIALVYSASRTYMGTCPFDMSKSPLKRVIIFP